ncbi:MAG TPA: flagellar biosynthetic protein FliQ [Myxococcales bacterium]|nr:flagellar biosynthetic protein FliQ [Myxococcales bacterium]HIN84978.1 flagellar biosynthetic protein FliQ [Myxococcales bacterium]
MDAETTVSLLRETITILFAISLPLLMVGLVVGLTISLVQAATQVQEASLVFVPKLIAVLITLWATAPWSGQKLVTFIRLVFHQVSQVGAGGGLGL